MLKTFDLPTYISILLIFLVHSEQCWNLPGSKFGLFGGFGFDLVQARGEGKLKFDIEVRRTFPNF